MYMFRETSMTRSQNKINERYIKANKGIIYKKPNGNNLLSKQPYKILNKQMIIKPLERRSHLDVNTTGVKPDPYQSQQPTQVDMSTHINED